MAGPSSTSSSGFRTTFVTGALCLLAATGGGSLVATRTWHEIIVHTIWISAVVWILLLLLFRSDGQLTFGDSVGIGLVGIPVSTMLGLIMYGMWVGCWELVAAIPEQIAKARQVGPVATAATCACVSLGVGVMGICLFLFRLHRRSTYGLTEAVAGAAAGISKFLDPSKPTGVGLAFFLLTASIYLVVRGLDNIHQGLCKEPHDPWAEWVLARLLRKYPYLRALGRAFN
jgi:hypothetical protein